MFIISDNFYQDPHDVRKVALSWDFCVQGNYPGMRTASCTGAYRDSIKASFEKIIGEKITHWPEEYNTAFQYTTKDSKTWVHHDTTEWAAVVYLTPNAPLNSGTAIYRHKETGIFQHHEGLLDFNEEKNEQSEWEIIAEAGNVFNRLVLYKGSYYHRSVVPGFGETKYNGRLFQTFFFST